MNIFGRLSPCLVFCICVYMQHIKSVMPSITKSILLWSGSTQGKRSWVAAHSWYRQLGHMKWNHTIKGRATKPVLPRQHRNEYLAALLWLRQICDQPMPKKKEEKKLSLPGANHVHPLRHNLDDDDKQNLFHRIAGRIVWNLICKISCNIINMDGEWRGSRTLFWLSVWLQ